MTYDSNNRVVKQVMANNAIMRYEYNDKEVIYTDPNGVKKRYIHDERNRHVATIIGDRSTKYVYNDKNERVQYTDMEGNVYKREFDNDGNIVKFWSPLQKETNFEFTNGRIAAITAPKGTSIRRLYDERGNVISYTDEMGFVTNMEYDEHGNLTRITNADATSYIYTYDDKCNLVSFSDCMGNIQCFEYDKAGRVIKMIDTMGYESGQTVDIDCVVIKTHANSTSLGYGGNSNDSFEISDIQGLEQKDVNTLILCGCNAGHTDYAGNNVASAFSNQVNGALLLLVMER